MYKKKTVKRLTSLILVLVLISSVEVFSSNQVEMLVAPYTIFLNGKMLSLKMPIFTLTDRTYVPLREFSEAIKMNVEWDGNEFIYLNGVEQDKSNLISMYIYPQSVSGRLAYQVKFNDDGRLAGSVGKTKTLDYVNEDSFFEPKVTRYNSLAETEKAELEELISKIDPSERIYPLSFDGWYVTVIYGGEVYNYDYSSDKKMWSGSDHMFEIVHRLMEYAPIDIVTYNYQDLEQVDYYESLAW